MNEYERYGEYTQQSSEEKSGLGAGAAIGFLLLGFGVGVATGLLCAPSSGRELRGNIRRRLRETVEGFGERAQNLKEGLKDRGSRLMRMQREQRQVREG